MSRKDIEKEVSLQRFWAEVMKQHGREAWQQRERGADWKYWFSRAAKYEKLAEQLETVLNEQIAH